MDKFTAELLLGAVANGAKSDDVATIYGILSRNEGGPTNEAIRWFNDHVGKTVKVKNTSYHGVVHELNDSHSGIYNGGRYPIYIKLDDSCFHQGKSLDGNVYEYSIEQLEVLCHST